MNFIDPNGNSVQDINWSNDGTVIAAAIKKNLILMDLRDIISTPIDNMI